MTSTAYAYKFDFDSEEPIPAHDPKPTFISIFGHPLIETFLAWDIVLIGAWACKWVYYGGSRVIMSWFMHFAPELYRMTTTGQM